jgi:hypothetical protein
MASGGGGDGGAAQARAEEAERQRKIRTGTTEINNIFDGYTKTFGEGLVDPAQYTDGARYYKADGSEFVYRAPAAAPDPSREGQQLPQNSGERNRENYAVTGTPYTVPDQLFGSVKTDKIGGQFGDDFYSGRKQAYLDYATPQLNDQYGEAQRQLAFALDRSGMLDSSVRAQKEADLRKPAAMSKTRGPT